VKTVPLERLQELALRIPDPPVRDSVHGARTSFNLERWIEDHGLDVEGPKEWNAGQLWRFHICPWNPEHRNKSAYIVQLRNGAIGAGCHHKGCNDKDWHALRDLKEPGWRSQDRHGCTVYPAHNCADWEPPIPFHQFDLPRFPTYALPDWLRAFVEAQATATQTPVDLSAMLTLSVLAASCAKKVVVSLKEDYFEPVNIFTATALPSGTRKTTVFAAVTKPLEDYERSESRRAGRENAKRRSAQRIKETQYKNLQGQAAGASGKEQEQFSQQAERLAAELADSAELLPTRLIADDCTPEKLATLLRDNAGRIAVMSAEGDVFELLAGRYSASNAPNFVVYLKGHAGDQLRIDRVGRTEFVNKPALTVGLAVQPDVIRGLAEKPGFRERGLLGRFLYALPANLLGRRDTNPPPVPADVRNAYYENVSKLLSLSVREGADGEADARILALDPDALEALQRFEQWVEPQLSEFGELGGMTDWAGKLVGVVGRIAGILQMASLAGSSAPWETPISRDTIERAICIAIYLIPHAKAAFAEMGADPVVEKAERILRWVEHRKLGFFSCRDLHQAMRGTFKRVAELSPPLAMLVDHGFLRLQAETSPSGPGRPPSPTYDVNPLWAAWHAQNCSELSVLSPF
jgi:replicative DNA helicase